jgi:2-iminobutanoate/2-iminopropanoate deaminase
VFLSGQLPINPETGTMPLGIENQTRQSLRNIQAILAATGLSLSDVIKNTVFLVDLGDFKAMNEAYQEYFPNCPPSRSCVQVSAVPKGALVEIETVAFVNKRL